MTQLVLQLNNFLNPVYKLFVKIGKGFVTIADVIIEARQRQVNAELARRLQFNSDFVGYSYNEILLMLETGKFRR
jgi:hypothetical protein